MLPKSLIIYLFVINLAAFVLYGVDKHKARRHSWRIPERTLLALAGLGGGIGALAGMRVFHHKTRHKSFTIGIPLLLILWIAGLCFALYRLNAI